MKEKQELDSKKDPIVSRLDALIRLIIEINKPEGKKEFNYGTVARILNSVGFTPTEIAKLLGKKSATDVSPYLYKKRKKLRVYDG